MFRFVLDGENYLVAEVALRFAISFCRCINLNRSRVDAITLGSRMLTISSDPRNDPENFVRHVGQGQHVVNDSNQQ